MQYSIPDHRIARKEAPAEYYDGKYKKGWVGPERYEPMYQATEEFFLDNKDEVGRVLEVGCGPGTLGARLNKSFDYRGIDFSANAIEMAIETYPELEGRVSVKDLYDPNIYTADVNTVLAIEVFEHIDDLRVIAECIRPGMNLFLSLPEYGASSHLRIYEGEAYIRDRFAGKIDIDKLWPVYILDGRYRIWLLWGRRSA